MSLRERLPILTDFLGPKKQPIAEGSDVLSLIGGSLPELSSTS